MRSAGCIAALLVACAAYAQDSTAFRPDLQLNGYVKAMPSVSWSPLLDETFVSGLLHNRLNFRGQALPHVRYGLEFRNRVFTGDQVKEDPTLVPGLENDPGFVDLSWVWLEGDAVVGHTTIDRAWAEYEQGRFVARVGRQRINWGMDVVWNPNDLFNTYNYLDFDYEERPGADAVTLRRYLGTSGRVELAVKPERDGDRWIAAGLYRFHAGSYDLQVLAGRYLDDLALGAGWAGNLGGSGLKGEATLFLPTEADSLQAEHLNLTATVDHSFESGLYTLVSVLYNSEGAADPGEAGNLLLGRELSPRNLMPYRITGFASAMYPFSPILSGSLAVMAAPGPNAIILFPSLSVSLGDDWQLDAFYQGYWQEVPGSGMEGLGPAAFLRLKWSY